MGAAAEYLSRTRLGAHFHETRESRELVLAVVAIALLLDNMLLTTVGKYLHYMVSFAINLMEFCHFEEKKVYIYLLVQSPFSKLPSYIKTIIY